MSYQAYEACRLYRTATCVWPAGLFLRPLLLRAQSHSGEQNCRRKQSVYCACGTALRLRELTKVAEEIQLSELTSRASASLAGPEEIESQVQEWLLDVPPKVVVPGLTVACLGQVRTVDET